MTKIEKDLHKLRIRDKAYRAAYDALEEDFALTSGTHRRTRPRRPDPGRVGNKNGDVAECDRAAGKRTLASVGFDAQAVRTRDRITIAHFVRADGASQAWLNCEVISGGCKS